MEFRWNTWNLEHVARHGVGPKEVVEEARKPYPRRIGDDKLLVWGRSQQGDLLQVIFVLDEDGSIYVVHARPLTERERRRFRRQGR